MIGLSPIPAALPTSVPFTGPETLERRMGRPFRARLGANESLYGPSPKAVAALSAAAHEAWMYGDPEAHDLKAAIAAHHGVTPSHVVVGEGIDGLLGLVCRLMLAQGDHAVTSQGAYPTFGFHVAGMGAMLDSAPYRDDHEDPEALLALARRTGARLLYIANPDNPMGSHHPGATIAAMRDHLPAGCLMLLDEAYVDLAPEGTEAPIPADDPRVIRFRTFSKAYGLAGLRLGYALCAPDLAQAFDKVRNHFGLGRPVQLAGIAALSDKAHLEGLRAWAHQARARLGQIARDNGLIPLPSATNFVTMDAGRDGTHARALLEALGQEGVFVRMPGPAPLNRCIRISLGDTTALDILAEALPRALARL
ncbi:pyridoxal phosphate-dependent aminotransferase [Stagnihabitans tardus]|uniref:Pyridoxal phosphate-dependent aminotransferase n=1 Tax=Stagnihabitans tardus TaxID=2699202 RepID=A0AAE5BR87_9RHOB|nr:pyridoxal phosphate-dependent aminotransferase [Stagnihabitans tardus]NBZ86270.1 pyridoxal phosphate-dependent aminotransferase [Stagnihabitans tardus]